MNPTPAPIADVLAKAHELKTDPEVFQLVKRGEKTFEIRKDDRGFAVGDVLHLRETAYSGTQMRDGAALIYTGDELRVRVLSILRGPVYGLADGWVIMGIARTHQSTAPSGQGQAVPELGDVVVFAIDTSRINHLMLDGMMDCLTAAKRARWTNVVTRKDAVERTWEADWLKHLQRLSPEALKALASQPSTAKPFKCRFAEECSQEGECKLICQPEPSTPPGQAGVQPVAWIWKYANGEEEVVFVDAATIDWDPNEMDCPSKVTPLYLAPPGATALRPLSRERMEDLVDRANRQWNEATGAYPSVAEIAARLVEAAHGITGADGAKD